MTQGAAALRGGGGPWEVCRESGSAGLPTREGPRHSPSTNVPNWPAGHETTRSCGGWRQTGSKVVRERVARNPHTPADVQARLAHDDKTEVRRAVAENPAAPEKVLEKLAGDATFVVSHKPGHRDGAPRTARRRPNGVCATGGGREPGGTDRDETACRPRPDLGGPSHRRRQQKNHQADPKRHLASERRRGPVGSGPGRRVVLGVSPAPSGVFPPVV